LKRLCLLLFVAFLFACSDQPVKNDVQQGNPYYDKAFEFKESGRFDSAFVFFNNAKEVFLQQEDSLGVGKCLLNMAIIATDKGDYFGGQELSLNASDYFDKTKDKHHIYIKSNLNNLGLTSEYLARYDEAISYFQQSLVYTTNHSATRTVKNNIANVYRRLANFDGALSIYGEILHQNIDSPEYARILSNFAYTKWLQNSSYEAEANLLKALSIRQKENNFLELNASYAHLTEYYANKKPDLALNYASKMYEVAQKAKSPLDQLQALQKLIVLSQPKTTKQYFRRYCNLDDSVQISRNVSKNQFALIRYQTEKHKADNLKLQKENAEKKYQITIRDLLLITSIILFLAAIIIIMLWHKKRKKRLHQEKELEVKNTELKYVKKVHDRVANKVYSVMMEVENIDNYSKTILADKLESIYKISRDISYETNDIDNKLPFANQLSQILNVYLSDSVKITINGNDRELWLGTSEFTKSEIINILQELMTNMVKHSQATEVIINFIRSKDQINIIYIDNGIGIAMKPFYKNGLKNTGNRITEINGMINFDLTVPKGLRIEISFPVF
jgi:tetratricopeptide (TPR) repeat protein